MDRSKGYSTDPVRGRDLWTGGPCFLGNPLARVSYGGYACESQCQVSRDGIWIFVLYYIHLEITGDPCNLIGPLQCDLFTNHTICAFFCTYLDNFSKEECIEEFRAEKNDLPFWQRPLEFHLFCVARRGPKFGRPVPRRTWRNKHEIL